MGSVETPTKILKMPTNLVTKLDFKLSNDWHRRLFMKGGTPFVSGLLDTCVFLPDRGICYCDNSSMHWLR